MQNIFSDHNGMKLEINNRRKIGKFTNLSKCNNTLNQWVKEEITRGIRIPKHTIVPILEFSKYLSPVSLSLCSSFRGVK